MANLKSLLIPVIILIIISFASFFYLLNTTINKADIASREVDAGIVQSHLLVLADSMTANIEDNSTWTDAYENIVVNPNIDWIRTNISNNTALAEGEFIFNIDNTILYTAMDDRLPAVRDFLEANLEDLLKTLTVDDYYTPNTRTIIQIFDNRLFIVGISLIQKYGDEANNFKITPTRRPVLVFINELSEQEVLSIGTSNGLNNLHLSSDILAGEAKINLGQNLGIRVIGNSENINLVWTPQTLSNEILSSLWLPSLIIISFLLVTFILFFRNASRMVNSLDNANSAKSDFLANMSHEIRTPLNAIIGFTEMMKSETYDISDSEKNKEYLDIVHSSSLHLLSLINDILDLSKVEAGQLEIFKEPFDVDLELTYCISTFQQLIIDKNLSLVNELTEVEIDSDKKLFHQTILNVLSNAVKFTPSNGTIKIKNIVENGHVIIHISDSGIGMDDDEVITALSKFGQVQSSYARNQTGTGLGLPLVSQIMNELGGHMELISAKGKGTTVSLFFPLN